jgi:fructokinase
MIAVLGENVVDLLMQPDDKFCPHLGGSPFNVAIGIGKQEVPVIYLSPISRDRFGDDFLSYMQTHGVEYGVPYRSELPSSVAIVTLDAQRQPHYSIYRHHVADRDISTGLLSSCLPTETRILHTGSLALEPEDLVKVKTLLAFAKSRGVRISIDINIRMDFVTDKAAYRDGIEELVPLCDYIKASDEDLSKLYPNMQVSDALDKFKSLIPNALFAYTEGDKGALLCTQTAEITMPVLHPDVFGDTVGAGDTFYSMLLSYLWSENLDAISPALLSDKQLRPALRHSIVAASINVSRHGCVPPSKIEVQMKLAN